MASSQSQTKERHVQPHYICQRFQALIWSCLESDLLKSAVFYAEQYFAFDSQDHDARHLYATSLLRCNQTHSALALVNAPADSRCSGCSEIKAKCCLALGRHRQAANAFEESLSGIANQATGLPNHKHPRLISDDAVLHCRAGIAAMKGNLPEKASECFQRCLSINPMVWEAFEGLCAVGTFPEIEDFFPSRPNPTKPVTPEESVHGNTSARSGPAPSGAGFFTPEGQGVVHHWMPELVGHQPFRIGGLPAGPRDSIATNDSSFFQGDNSIVQTQLRPSRALGSGLLSRPLSSAEETGPAPKRPRSLSRQAAPDPNKLKQPTADSRSKKARARPALMLSNFFSSRGSQPASPFRIGKADSNASGARRSSRLLSGINTNQTRVVKHPPQRAPRRHAHTRSRSTESEMDDDPQLDAAYSPSPPSVASPRSEGSPVPSSWPPTADPVALEAYENACADKYIYDLMRLFGSAAKALAMYDCTLCLDELNKIPGIHQRSAWVMAMAGRANYEMVDYAKAERCFVAARNIDPYRVWDMEVFSTLLWHLQRNVQLSFLAQELLNIDPRSPQAWIAVGNCFSLQKERAHAMTCFRRAAQLDPSCAYAYTLSGHESLDEDVEKAISFFQSALRVDSRHYNAWYGLGTCYLRMSKIRLAEYHYRKATEIHPNNAVLLGCVGMVLERRKDVNGAFALYDEAVRLAPDNALVRYRRAKIYIAKKEYRAAVEDLERLRDSSPEESNVVFQLARVYRLLGDEVKSAQMLAVARDVSPKSMSKIKKLLETCAETGDEMDEG